MMGEGGRTPRSSITSAAAVVVVEIAVVAAAGVAAVIVVAGVSPGSGRVDGLHRDLGSGLSRGVEDLSPGVVFGPELHCGLHGDLGLLGKAVAAVGWRRAAVAGGRRAIGGGRGVVGRKRTVAAPVRPVQVCMRFNLDHTIGTRATERTEKRKVLDFKGSVILKLKLLQNHA